MVEESQRSKPGLFAYLWCPVPDQPGGPYQVVALAIRASGILLVGATMAPVVWLIWKTGFAPFHMPSFAGSLGWLAAVIGVIGLCVLLAWAAAMSYFTSYTLFHWAKMDPEGRKYSAYLGEWLVFMTGAPAFFGITKSAMGDKSFPPSWTSILALAQSFLGVVILVGRMLPTARSVFHPPPSLKALFEG